MSEIDELVNPFAATNYGLTTRPLVLAQGGTDRMIASRLGSGRWSEVHSGVYLIGANPLGWKGQLRAATLACGNGAVASYRAASLLWGLDGIDSAPIEVTVPYARRPQPEGVVVHRTRRPIEPRVVDAIPVAPVERVILDLAWSHPSLTVEHAYETAIRRGLATPSSVADLVAAQGTFGVRGVSKVLRILDARKVGPPTGSPAETLLLRRMRDAGIMEPVCQYVVHLPDGTVAVIDFAWPPRLKGVEVDGLEAHASAQATGVRSQPSEPAVRGELAAPAFFGAADPKPP